MATLSFKVSPDEARRIKALARAENSTTSAFLRKRALGPQGRRSAKLVRDPVSGLIVDAGVGRKITSEEIKAALADFP
ncbi:plasmid mobilization protein [Nibricoccus sp. IMCC34717]|uniref:plasmid mobilization protein n=1 Tax=Nibricoccus sp. IMCC34717 TaxID=3034021 RepID=UPI00384CDB81